MKRKMLAVLSALLCAGAVWAEPYLTSRTEAFDAARAAGKKVVMFLGREATCARTQALLAVLRTDAEVQTKLDEGFVCWFNDFALSQDGWMYWSGSVAFPGLALIDPDSDAVIRRVQGDSSKANFLAFLAGTVGDESIGSGGGGGGGGGGDTIWYLDDDDDDDGDDEWDDLFDRIYGGDGWARRTRGTEASKTNGTHSATSPASPSGSRKLKVATTVSGCVMDASNDVVGRVELKLGKGGAAGSRVAGSVTVFGGKKYTLQTSMADLSSGTADVDLTVKRLGTMSLRLKLDEDGRKVSFAGSLEDGYAVSSAGAGKAPRGKVFFHLSEGIGSEIGGATVNRDLLPEGAAVSVSGQKWVCESPAKVKLVAGEWSVTGGPNKAGLKLSYTAKTGTFKGGFTVYAQDGARMKKLKATVAGMVVGGAGYGVVTVKGATSGVKVSVTAGAGQAGRIVRQPAR